MVFQDGCCGRGRGRGRRRRRLGRYEVQELLGRLQLRAMGAARQYRPSGIQQGCHRRPADAPERMQETVRPIR